jgi:hypothetical protein
MTKPTKLLLLVSFLSAAPACVGQVTGSDDDDDMAPPTPDAGGGGDTPDAAPPAVPTYDVSGKTMDYGSLDVLPQISLVTEGMTPPMQAISDIAGLYTLPGVGAGNAFILRASAAANFVTTTNPGVTVLDQNVTLDVYVVSAPLRDRQYATVNVTMTPGASLAISTLENLDGTPWAGVPLTGITLVDMAGQPVPGIAGPYFIGQNGDVDPALTVSTPFGNRGARVAFLNVPTGQHVLKVSYELTPGGPIANAQGPVMAFDDGATVTRTIHDPAADGGGTPKFATEVYPIFQKASKGGQDCASCHTAGGLGAVLVLDDGADQVFARLTGNLQYVNLATPADSLILRRPLYETPPDHPNATWLDATNPYYVKVLRWIQGGAPL